MHPTHQQLDPEDKDSYVEAGEEHEQEFVEVKAPKLRIDARINPEKADNKYAIDLIAYDENKTDLKRQTTPFFTAKNPYGIPAQYTVTFNTIDYNRYKEKNANQEKDIFILFWVTWDNETRFSVTVDAMEGVWKISMDEIISMVENDEVNVHEYVNRDGSDRNATHSYGLDLRQMIPVYIDDYRYFSQDELNEIGGVTPGEYYQFNDHVARIDAVELDDTAGKLGVDWKYPVDELGTLEENIIITVTHFPTIETTADLDAANSIESLPQREQPITAAGWETLQEGNTTDGLDLTKLPKPTVSTGTTLPADD